MGLIVAIVTFFIVISIIKILRNLFMNLFGISFMRVNILVTIFIALLISSFVYSMF